jgi:hypothetical protein
MSQRTTKSAEEFSPAQRKLLQQLMAQEGIDLSAGNPIRRQSDNANLEVSIARSRSEDQRLN